MRLNILDFIEVTNIIPNFFFSFGQQKNFEGVRKPGTQSNATIFVLLMKYKYCCKYSLFTHSEVARV